MLYKLPLLWVLTGSAIVASSDGVVVIQGEKAPLNTAPTFNHGYLATYEMGGIAVYAPNGSLAMRIPRPADGALSTPDMDLDGSVAVAVRRSAARYAGIAIFNPDGTRFAEIVTIPYRPSQVCFAPDHSIWVLGDEDQLPANERTNYFLCGIIRGAENCWANFFPDRRFRQTPVPRRLTLDSGRFESPAGASV